MADPSVHAANDSPPILNHRAKKASEKRPEKRPDIEKRHALIAVRERRPPRPQMRRRYQADTKNRIMAAVEKKGRPRPPPLRRTIPGQG
jgi:hypothetical protein